MQDWVLPHTIRNHVPAWSKIVLPCPCQGHQPWGGSPGPHLPGGMHVLTGILMTVFNFTLLSTLPHQLLIVLIAVYCWWGRLLSKSQLGVRWSGLQLFYIVWGLRTRIIGVPTNRLPAVICSIISLNITPSPHVSLSTVSGMMHKKKMKV